MWWEAKYLGYHVIFSCFIMWQEAKCLAFPVAGEKRSKSRRSFVMMLCLCDRWGAQEVLCVQNSRHYKWRVFNTGRDGCRRLRHCVRKWKRVPLWRFPLLLHDWWLPSQSQLPGSAPGTHFCKSLLWRLHSWVGKIVIVKSCRTSHIVQQCQ